MPISTYLTSLNSNEPKAYKSECGLLIHKQSDVILAGNPSHRLSDTYSRHQQA